MSDSTQTEITIQIDTRCVATTQCPATTLFNRYRRARWIYLLKENNKRNKRMRRHQK